MQLELTADWRKSASFHLNNALIHLSSGYEKLNLCSAEKWQLKVACSLKLETGIS